jgi:hypothetical protein
MGRGEKIESAAVEEPKKACTSPKNALDFVESLSVLPRYQYFHGALNRTGQRRARTMKRTGLRIR